MYCSTVAVALKLYPKHSIIEGTAHEDALEDFRREVELLDKYSRHTSLVRFIGVADFTNKVAIVIELARSSLAGYIQRQALQKTNERLPNGIPFAIKKKILRDISAGIAFLHSHGVCHRDLKPENVLVFGGEEESSLQFKLSDFGSGKVLRSGLSGSNNTL